jgi:hypothetical protein
VFAGLLDGLGGFFVDEKGSVVMAGYYLVVSSGFIHGRFQSDDAADDYIEQHMRMFPFTEVPERVFMEVC